MKSVVVHLAGRTYKIESLKFRAEREWRKKYDKPISDLVAAVSNVRQLSTKEFDKPVDLLKEVGSVLLVHAEDLIQGLLNSPDTLLDAICAYAPQLEAERDFIEENAYQDEIAKAFIEVLQIAYPFGSLLGIVTSLGSLEKQTSPSSPGQNGA